MQAPILMKKICTIFYTLVFITICLVTNLNATDVYRQEFKAFKRMQKYKAMFDHDANIVVKLIRRDIQNFSHLNLLQRFTRGSFLGCDAIVITEETMPKLYTYIDDMCKKHSIDTPTIFLTRGRGFFNAFAKKILWSSGAIIIGQHLLRTTSDEELEAVITHEIGHIKYNHSNKTAGIFSAGTLISQQILNYMINDRLISIISAIFISAFTTRLIINKQFEKQADKFAYAENGNAQGLIKLFEHLLQKDKDRDNDLLVTRKLLTAYKSDIGSSCYYFAFLPRYYLIKLGHIMNKVSKWICYHTPLSPHPSPETRIATVKKYLAQQQLLAQGSQNV